MKTFIPAHIRSLAKILGCTPAETTARIDAMRQTLKPHGITVTYVTRYHQWWISGFVGTGTLHGILKCYGIGAFIDYLQDPSAVIAWWQARTAEATAA